MLFHDPQTLHGPLMEIHSSFLALFLALRLFFWFRFCSRSFALSELGMGLSVDEIGGGYN